MQQSQTQRFLLGGIDSDNAPHAIEPTALLNSVNARALLSKDQTSSAIQFIDGNEEVYNITAKIGTNTKTLLGKCSRNDVFYFFFYDVDPFIVSYDSNTGVCKILIRSSWLIGGLNWAANMFVDCKSDGTVLVFTDNVNDVRYLNLAFDYEAYYNNGITITPIAQSMITLIQAPPAIPLMAQRTTVANGGNKIQFQALQFCYRVQNDVNFYSVLSPDSLTILPVRENDVVTYGGEYHNAIDVTVTGFIPQPNWKKVDLIVRYLSDNTFFVIKEFFASNPTDYASVISGNLFNGWTGDTLYALDSATASKEFDLIPLTSKALTLANNRVLLANNKQGYDTPTNVPLWNGILSNYNTSFKPIGIDVDIYMLLLAFDGGGSQIDTPKKYTLIIRCDIGSGVKNYFLANTNDYSGSFKEATGVIYRVANTTPQYFATDRKLFNPPYNIYYKSLIEAKEQGDPDLINFDPATSAISGIRQRLMKEVVAPYDYGTQALRYYSYKYRTAASEPQSKISPDLEPDNVIAGTSGRAFCPSTSYKTGIQFYDGYMRKSGYIPTDNINIPSYNIDTKTLYEKIDLTIASLQPAPSWAKYFSFVLSKQQNSQRIINFIPDLIKVAVQDNSGVISYAGREALKGETNNKNVYGIAIPLGSVIKNGYGYTYNQGDYVELQYYYASNPFSYRAAVKAVQDGYVIIEPTNDGPTIASLNDTISCASDILYQPLAVVDYMCLSSQNAASFVSQQYYVFATIYNNTTVDTKTYEIAKFGYCLNNQIQAFFDTNTLSTTIYGDHYTQPRTSNTGAYTGVSITTYEQQNIFPVNDTGRVTPIDTIGQKFLPTQISWSNTIIPGTNTNGYASFDVGSSVSVETVAGPIIKLATTTKGSQEGSLLLILCTLNSYSALLAKQQIVLSNQDSLITEGAVIATINPLHGKYGCQSPRSVVEWEGSVYWVDAYNKKIIEFLHPESIPLGSTGYKGVEVISRNGTVRLFNQLLTQVDETKITGGINPYTREYYVSVPAKALIPSLTIPGIPNVDYDLFDSVTYDNRTYVYNIDQKKWTGSWQSGAEFITDGTTVLSFKDNVIWQEFIGQPGVYYGDNYNALVAFPMVIGYPVVFSPQSIEINSNVAPQDCWAVVGNYDQVAQTAPFVFREGFMRADVLRDRLSNNATAAQYDAQGISGDRLKGNVIKVAMIWNNNSPIVVNEAGMRGRISSAQMLKK